VKRDGVPKGVAIMSRGITLAPCGLTIEQVAAAPDRLVITAKPSARVACCPACGAPSGRLHSRYRRSLSDLPSQGRQVTVVVAARRFRCSDKECPQQIFAERLEATSGVVFARRTGRLEGIVHHLALALGGRPGQNFAKRLLLPASNDTLLRTLRRHESRSACPPMAVGIDDFAWRRGHRYGTIIVDLERRRIVDILADREAGTVAGWLAQRPSIRVIARDRGAGYRQAATEGRPDAVQVADRWHLMENASAAFLNAVQCSMPAVRKALGAGAVDPAFLTAAERRQHVGWLRRQQENEAITAMASKGMSIKQIVRQTGRSRQLVRRVMRGGRSDMFRPRMNALEPFLDKLEAAWTEGCRNGAALWRRMKSEGFTGGLRVVTEWMTRRRRDRGTMGGGPAQRAPSARIIARMMTTAEAELPSTAQQTVAAIAKAVPALTKARDLVAEFQDLIRQRRHKQLANWLNRASEGLLSSFADGLKQDLEGVQAALKEPWSNGQTEGQNTKLKLVKRQMYGRAAPDLLRARLVGAS